MVKSKFLHIFIISFYAFSINWISGNQGILPIDSFAFFDTGFSILEGKYPIRDFWIHTGLLVDYIQALFFLILGSNWSAYVSHASFFNILVSLVTYFIFNSLNLGRYYSLFYSLSVATLCYPVAGTPFAYQHSFILSLISILIFCLAIKSKSNILWFILPSTMLLSFLSQQTPASYINLILLIFLFYFLILKKNIKNLKFFILGSFAILFLFFVFLLISKTPIKDFIYQYILFPITIGESRILNDEFAYTSFSDQLNFKRLIGDFKFINIFIVLLIFVVVKNFIYESNYFKKDKFLATVLVIFSSFLFIFHQLITANQIFIFSLIPILAGFLHMNLNGNYNKHYLKLIILIVVALASLKYHYRFNIERKFMDFENVNLEKAIPAEQLSPKLKNLNWITPFAYAENPQQELDLLKRVLENLKKDGRKKVLITHYQFMSLILNEDLNIFNRWYLDHNSHPTLNHKYFDYYKDFINKNLDNNNVEVIYLLGFDKKGTTFDKIKIYFPEKCFKNTFLLKNFSYHEIVGCK